MSGNQFTIMQTRLERAKSIEEHDWLEATFSKAARILDSGGTVKIMRPLSSAPNEDDAIIDTHEMLNYYKKLYFK